MSSLNFMEKLLEGVEVEWKSLGEIGEFIRGSGLQKSDFTETGIPAIHYGQIYTYYGNFADKTKTFVSQKLATKLKKAKKNDLIIATTSENIEDVCKPLVWLGDNEVCISGETYIFRHNQNAKYIAYYLQTPIFFDYKKLNRTGTKVIRVHGDKLAKFQIPIPPLHVQSEIVRILDNFTELTAELTARKKQYSYYRDRLLSFEDGEVEFKPFGEIALKISSGGTPKTDVPEYWENGTIPWMSSGEVNLETIYNTEKFITEIGLKNSSAKFVPKNSIVIALAGQGKTRGKVARTRIDLTTNQSLGTVAFDEAKINPDYIFHYLKTQYENLRQISSGSGTRGGLNLQMISNYQIPIPFPNNQDKSLAEQERIVNILDKFDTLTNSISEGLPKEIELRQKQYEYYRDLLLTFPKGDN